MKKKFSHIRLSVIPFSAALPLVRETPKESLTTGYTTCKYRLDSVFISQLMKRSCSFSMYYKIIRALTILTLSLAFHHVPFHKDL